MKNDKEFKELVKRAQTKRAQTLLIGQGILMNAGAILALFGLYSSGLPENGDHETAYHIMTLFGLLVASFGTIAFLNNK